jgi:hypothetical protein
MAKKNISLPFNFYCYTENPDGLNREIRIVPLDESLDLKAWWWKLTLFKRNDRPEGINLYLDLDVVIQNNIDEIFRSAIKNKLTLIETTRISMTFPENYFDPKTESFYNSSIMIWYNNENTNLYEKFITKPKLYEKVYHGIDRFFSYEINQNCFNPIDTGAYYFRATLDYSDYSDYSFVNLNIKRNWGSYEIKVWHNPKKLICIFNNSHQDYFYTGMEKYFF